MHSFGVVRLACLLAAVVVASACGEVGVETPLNSAEDALAFLANVDANDSGAVADDAAQADSSSADAAADVAENPDTSVFFDAVDDAETLVDATDDDADAGSADPDGGATADTTLDPDATTDAAEDDAANGACPGNPGCPCSSIADCDDGNPCTGPDSCISGTCAPAKLISCADKDECTVDKCDPKLGCQNVYTEDLECNDGDVCTAPDTCKSGACVGKTKSCDDNDTCTDDACLKSSGCQHYAKKDGSPCSDGSACTKDDACKSALCVGVGKLCKDTDPCTEDGCDSAGNCTNVKVQDGSFCTDGDKCTVDDVCKGGKCSGSVDECNDKNACTTDACAPKTGCSHKSLAENAVCDDGDACTKGTKCIATVCTGNPTVCDDDNLCTADGCDPKNGCNATPVGDGAPCATGKICKTGVCINPGGCPVGGFKGTYVVATSGKANWSNVSAAFADLSKCGVGGAVKIVVNAGTYTSKGGFVLNKIAGTSATNDVRFTTLNDAGVYAAVKLAGVHVNNGQSGILFVGKDVRNVTLEGFTFDGANSLNQFATPYSAAVGFSKLGGQQDITLRRLTVTNFASVNNFKDYNYIAAVLLWPASSIVGPITIDECTFSNLSPAKIAPTQAVIYALGGSLNQLSVTRNRFVNIGKFDAIQLHSVAKLTSLLVANNEAVLSGGGFLELYTKATVSGQPRVVFNSLFFEKSGFALKGISSGATVLLRNNIFSTALSSPPQMVQNTAVTADHNCLHNVTAGYTVTEGIAYDPNFLKPAPPWDLHIAAASPVKGQGVAIPGVTTDKDGDKRENPPDMGMDEVPGSTALKPCVNAKIAKMKGVYSLGVGGDFKTFSEAFVALKKCGVGGATVIEAAAGQYVESDGFDIPAVEGVSAVAPLTFRAAKLKSGYALVQLHGLTPGGARRGTVRFAPNAKHITIEGFVLNGQLPKNALLSSYQGAVVLAAAGNQSDITVRNMRFYNYSVSSWKAGYTGMFFGFVTNTVTNLTIEGCTFESLASSNSSHHTLGAIVTRQGTYKNLTIHRNRFIALAVDAINVRDSLFDNAAVYNNMFVVSGPYRAVDFVSSPQAVTPFRFVFNSILLTSGLSKAIVGSLQGKGIDVRNNAVSALSGKPTFVQQTQISASGYNCLGNVAPGYTVSTGDVMTNAVGFVKTSAEYDLHLTAASKCLNKGTGLAGITVDFDGHPRGATPDIGADELKPEFTAFPHDL